MKRVCVITENEMLYRKIKLELAGVCEVYGARAPHDLSDGVLVDADNPKFCDLPGIKMSKTGGDIPLPFKLGTLCELFKSDGEPKLKIGEGFDVFVGNRAVRLTEVEFSLFLALFESAGEYVSRGELVRRVWGEGFDEGVLNVYVHYLRAKLEADGERIITCSRGKGYKINEEYLGGRNA
ncbi:MAG: winged helix-turn-helix transcriptional regulator [Clostridia bacterium]|nr:winged helix-turn-helix transcriptional regulator [Clostridia bacterium]